MKPNFSLSLSFDGISLLYRGKSGWSEVGSVSLEDADLSGSLAALRAEALELAPDGIRSKLIIPNDQIKYLDLPGKGLKDADVRAALEGATPYAVEELSYDFSEHESGTAIAAIANETLEEAEAFAAEHEFGPVSFVAVPDPDGFPGEPFFGKAKAASGTRVTRDKTPVPLTTIPSASAGVDQPTAPETASEEVESVSEAPQSDTDAEASEEQSGNEIKAQEVEAHVTDVPSASSGPDLSTEEAPSEEDASEPTPDEIEPEAASFEDNAQTTPPASFDSEPETVASQADSAPEDDGMAIGAASDEPVTPEISEREASQQAEAPETAPAQPEHPEESPSEEPTETAEPASTGPDRDEAPDPDQEPAAQPDSPEPALAEPVFSSRLRSVREELDIPPASSGRSPSVRLPNGSVGAQPAAESAAQPAFAATPRIDPVAKPGTPMPPAVAEAMKKVGQREAVPPRAGAGTEERPPAFRPATPPPPAVSKALRRVQNSPDLPPINGAAAARPIPGAGPQAPVSSAPPSLPSAPSRSDVPPPVRQMPKSPPVSTSETAIPAPPAEVAASLSASVGPAGASPSQDKGGKRRFGLIGRGRTKDKAPDLTAKAPAARSAPPEPVTAKPEAVRSESEKERLTIFGARRKDENVRGKPRFLGLILTAVLLLLMAAVAAWATISSDSFARFFGLDDTPTMAADAGDEAAPTLAATPPQASVPAAPAFEPTPLPADESPLAPGSVPSGDMLLSETGSLLPDPDLLRALSAPTPAQAVAEVPGAVLSPAAAERFYAATGVWLRAPRLPVEPQPEPLGTVVRTLSEVPPALGPTPQLPQTAPDAVLVAQVNPPPPDMRFERDDRGFLLATPEGTVTPYGLTIYAGSPSIVPPTRPGTPPVIAEPQAPPAAEIAEAPAPVEETPQASSEATDLAAALPEPEPAAPADPIVADATESLAPQALAVLEQAPVRPDARISTAGSLNAAAISLNGIRPNVRPDDAVPEDLLPEVQLAAFAGPRPSPRPEGLAPEPDPAEAPAEEEAPPANEVEDALAGILQGAADPLASATPNAVASAIRPDSRPNNFDRVVQQARSRQSQAPAASAPAAASEPEAVSNAAAQPTGPVPQTVASAATQENAINLRQINLIGVYGRPSDRRALVRLSNGRYVRVGVGDRLDGGRVAAIEDNTLSYVKSGRNVTLEIPSG
ncbi:hypothetical protein JQU17_15955 [Ponticoccus sp. SC2-23]|uniref:hypothetical protein n=1 Tax=Alexandriicola marinus TaxID=2081710 RepID=UPI000FD820F6|nr:hypothetical protein [Alexandriicola marinus]MBM1220849.1 hypothetical protein [Ponticoccus sp. SC6-9]MBM1225419.1 hypothetical protein [Ponticoccus sp. SC6-15]MBM1227602.1 hypothetical protein [Ponticoccus sp. SC6-38]MBM1234760.1 hypothetical protein [Ponticoccus sp. SC6-45]MBM1238104.1 hypothetical protein [Ponticoccus sp. SC6-49]MBM1244263.1 hypothetical protein [Ponticoccus sp. SC2-64]MBM1248284.1 hypothetical protein [Ponticoccus sp. SC6-42]MBM1252504.1 hypothetical protein [Pontico